MASLFTDNNILKQDVLAIQEPWRNQFIATTYHPLKKHFTLMYLDDAETRVCFYVSTRIDPVTWSVSYPSKDIVVLNLKNPQTNEQIHIFNVYNQPPNSQSPTNTLSALAEALDTVDPSDGLIVLGDFNIHHPLWSANPRHTGRDRQAQHLLTIKENFQLHLLTAPGAATHRTSDGKSTIDLTFATEQVADSVIRCRIEKSLDHDSDHLPIATVLDWNWQLAKPARKRLWSKTDSEVLRKVVEQRLQSLNVHDLSNTEEIDKFVDQGPPGRHRCVNTMVQTYFSLNNRVLSGVQGNMRRSTTTSSQMAAHETRS